MAFGAQLSVVNLRGWHAEPPHLAAVYVSQVQMNGVGVVFTKLLSNIWPHLITAFPDPRTNCDV